METLTAPIKLKLARARLRSKLVLALASVLTLGCVVFLGASPAEAASHTGELRLKGPAGSGYTKSPFVSQVGTIGSTLTYTLQVVNTGPSIAQYNVKIEYTDVPVDVYDGALALKPLTDGPDGYYTKAIPAGGNQVLTVKIKVPNSAITGEVVYTTSIRLGGTDGVLIDYRTLYTNEAAPTLGTTSSDLFSKNGSQKLIGGSRHPQILTATTTAATGTATFTETLQNNGAVPGRIYFRILDSLGCASYVVTVKDGAVNVTAAAFAGTYQSPVLAKAGKRNLTVSVKANGAACSNYADWLVQASTDGINWTDADILLVNLAA